MKINKKYFKVLFLVLFLATYSYSQESKIENLKKNELKWHPFNFKLDITYERILNGKNSIGISIGNDFIYDGDTDSFGILPYYRRYFSSSDLAKGFFIEANTLLYEETTSESFQGIGAALGYKKQTSKDFIFETFMGLGFKDELSYYRFSFMIGKRF